MKIALLTDVIYPFTIGGSEMRNYEIAKRLARKGHEVHILGAKMWKGKNKINMDGVTIIGLSEYERLYDSSGKRRVIDPLKLSFRTFRILLKEDYDIVDNLSFVFFNCYASKLASLVKKNKLVFTWQQYFGSYLLDYFGYFKGMIAMLLERISVGLTKNNVVVSNHVGKELESRGISKKNIKLIYNGVDISLARNMNKTKKKYDLVFVGRLNYQKNPQLFIQIVNEVKKEIPNVRAVVVGDGSERKSVENLVKSLNLRGNVEFVGNIKDRKRVFSLVKSSKVFILPSRLEGFPLTIVEANALGVPVLTTKTKWNDVEDYLNRRGISGFALESSLVELTKGVLKILEDKKLYQRMSINGMKKARNYDWDNIAEQTESYYSSLIN
jgi:glycosyltransferase involved in cell wall biosynthesis